MNRTKIWMIAGLGAGALFCATAVQAQDGPTAFPAPNAPAIYRSAADLDKMFQAEIAKKAPLSQGHVSLTDRSSLTLVRRDEPNTPVKHPGWSELHYYLEGSGTVEIGGASFPVKAGDFVYVPDSSPHHYSAVNGHIVYYEIRFPDAKPAQPDATIKNPPPAPAAGGPGQFFSGDALSAALAKASAAGGNGIATAPVMGNDRFIVNIVKRSGPALPISHPGWNEFAYVIAGKATMITGGTITGSGKDRKIEGGISQVVQKGDVMIVPDSTPHQYASVDPDVTYMEVHAPDVSGGVPAAVPVP